MDSLWPVSAATALVTTKYILVDVNYHYPLHLLLIHLFFAGVACAILQLYQSRSTLKEQYLYPRWAITLSPNAPGRDLRSLLLRTISTLAMAASMPLLMQSVIHFSNLPTLAMLSLFPHLFETIVFSLRFRVKPSGIHVVGLGSILVACITILYFEYRLMANGLAFALPALALTGVARGLGAQCAEMVSIQGYSYDLVIPVALIGTGVWATLQESSVEALLELWKPGCLILSLNIVATTTALLASSSIISPPQDPPAASATGQLMRYGPFRTRLTSFLFMTGLVALCSTAFTYRAYSTIFQVVSFVGACMCLAALSLREEWALREEGYTTLDADGDLPTHVERNSVSSVLLDEVSKNESVETDFEILDFSGARPLSLTILSKLFLLASVLTWLAFFYLNFTSYNRLPDYCIPSYPLSDSTADTDVLSDSSLDVVISHYREPESDIISTISYLRNIPPISQLDLRLHIYTKDELATATSLVDLQRLTNATSVTHLPNLGREGHTYLHHLLTNFDDLAPQTIFLQAHVDNAPSTFHRLARTYRSDLGFAPLGLSAGQSICSSCAPGPTCSDRFGWSDPPLPEELSPFPDGNPGLLDFAYRAAQGAYNNESALADAAIDEDDIPGCADPLNPRPISLTYKGQFLASRARLQRPGIEVYQLLLELLEDPQSVVHRKAYLGDRTEELSAPVFGFSLERAWGVLMGCAEGAEAWREAGLLSEGAGWGLLGGREGWGGCLDGAE